MFARLTAYQMRQGAKEEATDVMNSLREQIMAMPGILEFTNILGTDGAGYILTIAESEAQSNANAAKTAALWAKFAPYMVALPKAQGYEVMANWIKQGR